MPIIFIEIDMNCLYYFCVQFEFTYRLLILYTFLIKTNEFKVIEDEKRLTCRFVLKY